MPLTCANLVTLDGPKIVTRTIRPIRVAYVVQTQSHCDAFIQACSLTWGGKHFCVVPYDEATHISDEWWRVLHAYDPDMVISCMQLDSATDRQLVELTVRDHPRTEYSQEHSVYFWDIDRVGIQIHGQSLFSSLSGAGAYEKRDSFITASTPNVSGDGPFDLFLKARYGFLSEVGTQSVLIQNGFKANLRLSDFVPVNSISVANREIELILGLTRLSPELRDSISLLDYTLVDLTQRGEGRSLFDVGNKDIVHDAQHILIVSDGVSVEDFCWYWCLRAQRYLSHNPLPIWVPKAVAEERIHDLARSFHPSQRGFILSKSVAHDDLALLAARLGHQMVARTSELDAFYSNQFFLGIQDRQEVVFDNGRVRIPLPQADVVKHCRHPQRYFVDVELPRYRLPRLGNWMWGDWNFANYRVSSTGLSFQRYQGIDQYIELRVPTPWEIIQTYADIAGYKVSKSDKGILAERVMQLVGGADNTWIFSSATVYALLNQLAELRQSKEFKERLRQALGSVATPKGVTWADIEQQILPRMTADYHERIQQQFSQMRQILGFNGEVVQKLIQWLIHYKVIFRGIDVRCPSCKTEQWLDIDSLSSTLHCAGCQQYMDVPLSIDTITWKYRINSLYARAIEQGVLPHIYVVNHYLIAGGYQRPFLDSSIIGAFPGLKLEAKPGASVPATQIEIDVAWIADGELYIGECKTNGRELLPADIERYLRVAQTLQCGQVFFAVLDDIANIPPESRSLLSNPHMPIALLTRNELLDQYPGKAIRVKARQEGESAPVLTFEQYLMGFPHWFESLEHEHI